MAKLVMNKVIVVGAIVIGCGELCSEVPGVDKPPAQTLSVCEIAEKPESCDGKIVSITGQVRIIPHNMLLVSDDCRRILIVASFTDSPYRGARVGFATNKDEEYRRLKHFLRKPYPEIKGLTATL